MPIEPSSWATYFVARGSSFLCSVGRISLGSFSITRVSLVAIWWTFDLFRKLHVDQCAQVEQVSLVVIPIPLGCLLAKTLWSILLHKLSHDMRGLGLKGLFNDNAPFNYAKPSTMLIDHILFAFIVERKG